MGWGVFINTTRSIDGKSMAAIHFDFTLEPLLAAERV